MISPPRELSLVVREYGLITLHKHALYVFLSVLFIVDQKFSNIVYRLSSLTLKRFKNIGLIIITFFVSICSSM
jgi:hypothetical protein